MFCDSCGTQLQATQKFCSGCGKPVSAGMIPAYPQRNRIQEHVRLLAILWFAFSAFEAIGGVVLLVLANTLFMRFSEFSNVPHGPANFLHILFTVLGIYVLAKSVAGFFTGWGLLNREPWARIMALVLGFLSLIHPPLGTALGVYTLWVLLPASSEAEYHSYQRSAAA
ncbi:MAG TPA: zinc ribbon domain-containing protein [Terriglobales bacterium]